MFIVPISHENMEARRWPVVTIAIVALNVLAFVGSLILTGASKHDADAAATAYITYAQQHDHLKLACRGISVEMNAERPSAPPSDEPSIAPSVLDAPAPAGAADGASADGAMPEEQAELDRLCATYQGLIAQMPDVAYGDVPARGGVLTLFTHQFLHGGVLHILFNLWFLWLCGTNLEDRWGRAVFPIFYLASGAVGALLHRAMNVGSWEPLIGASGAIAGAMGGFLVAYASTRIVFFYLYFLSFKPRFGTFGAPAYVMLPLWLVGEVVEAAIGQRDGTAHYAHIGGFAFGVVIALGLKLSGVDAKLDAMNEDAISTHQDPRLVAAMELTDAGRPAEALVELAVLARERPTSIDVALETLRAASAAKDAHKRVDAYLRLMELYVEEGAVDTAADLFGELRLQRLEASLPRAERLRLAELFARKGRHDTALLCAIAAHADGLVDPVAVRAAVMHATLLVRLGRLVDARPILEDARSSPFSTVELDEKIDAQLAAIEARTSLEVGGAS